MAKRPFMSWLFGHEPEEDEAEDLAEEARPGPEPPSPAEEPDPRLRFPPEHAWSKLWSLYRGEGAAPAPALELLLPGGERLPPPEEKQELMRLQLTVNATANQRLKKTVPKTREAPVPDLDAQVVCFVTVSQLAAWVLVYPPVGEGGELEDRMLDKALRDAGIRYGVDEDALDRIAQEEDQYLRLFPVAVGEGPVHGKDGYVVDLFPRKVEQKFAVDDYGRLDYSTLNLVQNVAEGDVICRIIPPVEGVPGRTVLDKELPARAGRAASPVNGRNTKMSEDGRTLVATQSGHVEFTGRSFQVKPVLEIEGDVDYSVGNINFVGDVHIQGDVHSGFSVRAMGSITVDGVVEACSIEAGGDLTVAKGIAGNDQAVIRAQRSIFTKYIESSCVYARTSLQTECIMGCDVYSDGVVEVRAGRATIVGGRVWAAQEVSAGTVGSLAESRTEIELGGLPCEEFEREVLIREIAEIEADLEKTELQPDSAAKLGHLSKTRVKLTISRNKLEQVDRDLEELRKDAEGQARGRLTCDVAYRGTRVTIGGVTRRVRQETRPCNATLVDGEIAFS